MKITTTTLSASKVCLHHAELIGWLMGLGYKPNAHHMIKKHWHLGRGRHDKKLNIGWEKGTCETGGLKGGKEDKKERNKQKDRWKREKSNGEWWDLLHMGSLVAHIQKTMAFSCQRSKAFIQATWKPCNYEWAMIKRLCITVILPCKPKDFMIKYTQVQ